MTQLTGEFLNAIATPIKARPIMLPSITLFWAKANTDNKWKREEDIYILLHDTVYTDHYSALA
jgi:hypothetical protein